MTKMKNDNLWALLKRYQERIGIIMTLIALAVGAVNSFTDRSNPPILALSIFSVGAIACCIWLFIAKQPSSIRKSSTTIRRYSNRRSILFTLLISLFVLMAWSFVYRVQIRYSKLTDKLLGGNRVLVSNEISKYVLKRVESTPNSVYSILNDLEIVLNKSDFRIVLIDEQNIEAYLRDQRNIQPRDQFVITGEQNQLGTFITIRLPINEPRFNELKKWYANLDKVPPEGRKTLYPYWQYLPIKFFFSFYEITLPLPANSTEIEKIASVQIGLRYILAQTLYLNGESTAQDFFNDILGLAPLIQDVHNEILSRIYKGVGYYFATKNELHQADQALQIARNAYPSDAEVNLMLAYIQFSLDEIDKSQVSLDMIQPDQKNHALISGLRADIALKKGDQAVAIEEMKTALNYESDVTKRAEITFTIAAAYGTMGSLEPRLRGSKIVEYTSMSVELVPKNYISWALLGYGWALYGNVSEFNLAFRKAQELSSGLGQQMKVSYWLAKSRLVLGQEKEVLSMIESILKGEKNENQASMLFLYAQALYNDGGPIKEVEAKLRESLSIDNRNSSSATLLAKLLIAKIEKLQDLNSERAKMVKEAHDLLTMVLTVNEDEYAHNLLGHLYELTGDEINADKQHRLGCLLSSEVARCILNLAIEELNRNELDLSLSNLALLSERVGLEKELPIELVHFTYGLAWYKKGDLLKSEMAYEKAINSDSDGDLGAQNNLAFVKFDLGKSSAALELWDQFLKKNPTDADAHAGRASALVLMGRKNEAVASYRLAVEVDENYLNKDWMIHEHLWSTKAIAAAAPLIEAIKKEKSTK